MSISASTHRFSIERFYTAEWKIEIYIKISRIYVRSECRTQHPIYSRAFLCLVQCALHVQKLNISANGKCALYDVCKVVCFICQQSACNTFGYGTTSNGKWPLFR